MLQSRRRTDRCRAVWWVSLLGVVTAVVMMLTGCGSVLTGEGSPARGRVDVALFPGEANPAKVPVAATRGGADEKALLPVDGSWRYDGVAQGQWERHRFQTKAGYTYVVEVVHYDLDEMEDDPDLYLSRDADPYAHFWQRSYWGGPLCEVIVFRAGRDGTMYVGVVGYHSGPNNVVKYAIRVRQRLNPRNE